MSSCQRAKPFTGLVNGFPPVVGLAPDPAAFSSSRLSGSPGLTKNQRGRALDGASQASSRFWRERALGTLGADNGGERVPTPPLPHGRETSALPPHGDEGALDHFSSRQPTHRTPFIPIASKQPPNPRTGCTQDARNVPRTRFSHLPVPCSTSRGRTAHRPLFAPFRRGPVFTAFSLSPLIPVILLLLRENWGIEGFFSFVISRNPPGDLYSNH